MVEQYKDIIAFIAVILINISSNFVNRINIKSQKSKIIYLKFNRIINIGKDGYILLWRAIFYLVLSGISIVIILRFFNINESIFTLYGISTAWKSIVICIIAIIVSIKMFFLTATIIIYLLMKKNLKDCITNVKWIGENKYYRIYTRIIRPLFIGIFEGLFYCVILNGISTQILGIGFFTTTIILSSYYGVGKSFLMKEAEEKFLMLFFGFWFCFVGTLLYGFTGNIVCTIILFILGISFWAFKR